MSRWAKSLIGNLVQEFGPDIKRGLHLHCLDRAQPLPPHRRRLGFRHPGAHRVSPIPTLVVNQLCSIPNKPTAEVL